MTQKHEEITIGFTTETVITQPKRRNAMPIYPEDWDRLKSYIRKYQKRSNWCWFAFSIFITAFFSTLSVYFTNIEETIKNYFLIATISFISLSIFAFVVATYLSKLHRTEKGEILEEMERLELLPKTTDEEVGELLKQIPAWQAKHKPENNQGIDYKELPLNNRAFKFIEIKVKSQSPYWRAGIKLSESNRNSEPVPVLRTQNSILFHTGVTNNNVYIWLYNEFNVSSNVQKTIKNASQHIKPEDYITLKITNNNSMVSYFMNEDLIVSNDYPMDFLRKAYIVAWGDGNDYIVDFNETYYDN